MKVKLLNSKVEFVKSAPLVLSLNFSDMTLGRYLGASGLSYYEWEGNAATDFVPINAATKLIIDTLICGIDNRQYSSMIGFYSEANFDSLISRIGFEDISTDEEARTIKKGIEISVPENTKYIIVSANNIQYDYMLNTFKAAFKCNGYVV